jgi:hypothetical protein
MTGENPRRRIFEQKGQPYWANDGRQVIISVPVGERYRKFETWRVNADGTGRTKEGSIELVELDGSNLRKVSLPPGRWNLHLCDWQRLTQALRAQSVDQAPDLKTTRGRYQALIEEYKTAFKVYDQARKSAKTPGDRAQVEREKYSEPRSYVDRFLAIAESAPADAAAMDALIWIVQRGFDGPEYDRAIDLLVQRAGTGTVDRDALAVSSPSPSLERLFRTVVGK